MADDKLPDSMVGAQMPSAALVVHGDPAGDHHITILQDGIRSVLRVAGNAGRAIAFHLKLREAVELIRSAGGEEVESVNERVAAEVRANDALAAINAELSARIDEIDRVRTADADAAAKALANADAEIADLRGQVEKLTAATAAMADAAKAPAETAGDVQTSKAKAKGKVEESADPGADDLDGKKGGKS